MNENIPIQKSYHKEHIPVPFMEGYEIFFSGGEVNNEKGEQIQTMDIWKEGDEEEGWDDLTQAGFLKVVNFVEEQMRRIGIQEFVIEATDDRRQRIFEKWAERRGCKVRELPDWEGQPVKVFTLPE